MQLEPGALAAAADAPGGSPRTPPAPPPRLVHLACPPPPSPALPSYSTGAVPSDARLFRGAPRSRDPPGERCLPRGGPSRLTSPPPQRPLPPRRPAPARPRPRPVADPLLPSCRDSPTPTRAGWGRRRARGEREREAAPGAHSRAHSRARPPPAG